METLPRDVLLVGVLTRVQNLGGGHGPLKIWKGKNRPKFKAI